MTELSTGVQTAGYARACPLAALAEDSALHVDIDGTPVCIARSNGEVYAIYDVCSHADVPLSEGEVEDGTVECWLHGSRFDLRTGCPTGLPATVPVPVYPTLIDGDDVLVRIEPEHNNTRHHLPHHRERH